MFQTRDFSHFARDRDLDVEEEAETGRIGGVGGWSAMVGYSSGDVIGTVEGSDSGRGTSEPEAEVLSLGFTQQQPSPSADQGTSASIEDLKRC